VFGEIVEGLDVISKIGSAPTGEPRSPGEDIVISTSR